MIKVLAERDSPSDTSLVIVDICVEPGEFVAAGTLIFELEGAKSVFEQTAPTAGYFYHRLRIGSEVKVGNLIGIISDRELSESEIENALTSERSGTTGDNEEPITGPQMSQKAQELWDRLGRPNLTGLLASKSFITLQDIRSLEPKNSSDSLEHKRSNDPVYLNFRQACDNKAVLLGGNRGAIQVLDTLGQQSNIEILGFLQDHGPAELEHFGFRNLGSINELSLIQMKKAGVQTAFLAIGGPPERIEEIIAMCEKVGIALPPIIHESAVVSATARVGQGARIMAMCSIGPHATVGEGAFVSSYSNIEHHSVFGRASHCGPGLLLSGGVTVGDGTRFGVNVGVEPGVSIGAGATLASGTTVTSDVPEGTTLKKRVSRHNHG